MSLLRMSFRTGMCPLTIRAKCVAIRDFPDPLGSLLPVTENRVIARPQRGAVAISCRPAEPASENNRLRRGGFLCPPLTRQNKHACPAVPAVEKYVIARPSGRGNLPVQCCKTEHLATDPPCRTHLSFTENPTWKQEIATGLKALAMTWKWGGGRSGPAEWISLRWREG